MFNQISIFNEIAKGNSTFDLIGEQIEESQNAAAVCCMDFMDNIKFGNYYPVVRYGECANVVCEKDTFIQHFVSYISKALDKEKIGMFALNAENMLCQKILLINGNYGEEDICPNVEPHVLAFEDVFSYIHSRAKECRIVAVQITGNEVANIKETVRAFEDLAESCNIALMVFWLNDDKIKKYFASHGHNICVLRDFDCNGKSVIMFEFGGICPKRVFMQESETQFDLFVNDRFVKFLKVRNFFWLHTPLEKTNDYELSNRIKYELHGLWKFQYQKCTIQNFMNVAHKYKVAFSTGRGKNIRYKYNPGCEQYLQP